MRRVFDSLTFFTGILLLQTWGCDSGASSEPGGMAGSSASAGSTALPAAGSAPNASAGSTSGGGGPSAGSAGAAGGPSTAGTTSAAGTTSTAGSAGTGGAAPGGREGFWVDGRFLRDRCGSKVVLRGINEMIVWSPDKTGTAVYKEIAKTGANAVRIVWTIKDGTAAEMDSSIGNAVAEGLVPIIELHDATGKFELLPSLVDHWTSPDIVTVLKKHAAHVLVNIGNEVGAKVNDADFSAGYKTAISRMRAAGLRMPLVIDGTDYGQNIDQLQSQGPGLIAADPEKNILLSVHMWWTDGSATRITQELTETVNANLPLIVGEFANHAVYECSKHPFDYAALLAEAKTKEIGVLPWSWGQVKNSDCSTDGPFDMTTDGTFSGLTGWGEAVATTDPNSIKNTSVRVSSLAGGECAK